MTKQLKWQEEGSVITPGYTVDDKHIPLGPAFNLVEIFPTFDDFSKVEKYLSIYGTKQRLADFCARPKDQKLTKAEMVVEMERLWTLWKSGVVKPEKKTMSSLERVEKEYTATRLMADELISLLKAQGQKAKAANEIAQKMFGSKLQELRAKIKTLKTT